MGLIRPPIVLQTVQSAELSTAHHIACLVPATRFDDSFHGTAISLYLHFVSLILEQRSDLAKDRIDLLHPTTLLLVQCVWIGLDSGQQSKIVSVKVEERSIYKFFWRVGLMLCANHH